MVDLFEFPADNQRAPVGYTNSAHMRAIRGYELTST
jgi:hypothetical protein